MESLFLNWVYLYKNFCFFCGFMYWRKVLLVDSFIDGIVFVGDCGFKGDLIVVLFGFGWNRVLFDFFLLFEVWEDLVWELLLLLFVLDEGEIWMFCVRFVRVEVGGCWVFWWVLSVCGGLIELWGLEK